MEDYSIHDESSDSPTMYSQNTRVAANIPNPFMEDTPTKTTPLPPMPSPMDMKKPWVKPTFTIEPRQGKGWK